MIFVKKRKSDSVLRKRGVKASMAVLGSFVLLCIGSAAYSQDISGVEGYRLGAGDRIVITVFGEEDLSMEVRLNSEGTLTYPFLGEMKIEGLTVGELEQKIVAGLKGPYLVDPDVTVSIDEYREFFVYGEVERPGSYPYQPSLTVEKAVAVAGGFTERAARNKIDVTRAKSASAGATRVKLSDEVRAGDVITVYQSLF